VAAGVDVMLPPAPPARLLVLNPNTNPEVTHKVRQVAAPFATTGLRIDVAHPPRGPLSIENATQRAEAEQEVLAVLAALPSPRPDAVVLACFDDLALEAARALTGRPVVGCCAAGIAAARSHSTRFAILTTVHDAVPGIRVLMQRYAAGPQASVRAAGVGVADAARAGSATLDTLTRTAQQAIAEDGAQAILLASGGLTTLGPELAQRLGIPVVDAVQAAVAEAAALLVPLHPG
jgi:allantoin racemase